LSKIVLPFAQQVIFTGSPFCQPSFVRPLMVFARSRTLTHGQPLTIGGHRNTLTCCWWKPANGSPSAH